MQNDESDEIWRYESYVPVTDSSNMMYPYWTEWLNRFPEHKMISQP